MFILWTMIPLPRATIMALISHLIKHKYNRYKFTQASLLIKHIVSTRGLSVKTHLLLAFAFAYNFYFSLYCD